MEEVLTSSIRETPNTLKLVDYTIDVKKKNETQTYHITVELRVCEIASC